MLFCVIGPSFPGLLTRTITITLIGCCCVAVAAEPAPTTAEIDYLLGRRFGSPARRAFAKANFVEVGQIYDPRSSGEPWVELEIWKKKDFSER